MGLGLRLPHVMGFAALAVIGLRLWTQPGSPGASGGMPAAPEVTFQTLAGASLSLGELRGQVVLVNFWATWCGPCREEMPTFQRAFEEHQDEGFTIIGLSKDVGTPDLVRDFIAEYGITYPVGAATPDVERAFGGIWALPTSILIDRQGRIRHRVHGVLSEPELESALAELLVDSAEHRRARAVR